MLQLSDLRSSSFPDPLPTPLLDPSPNAILLDSGSKWRSVPRRCRSSRVDYLSVPRCLSPCVLSSGGEESHAFNFSPLLRPVFNSGLSLRLVFHFASHIHFMSISLSPTKWNRLTNIYFSIYFCIGGQNLYFNFRLLSSSTLVCSVMQILLKSRDFTVCSRLSHSPFPDVYRYL